VIAIDTKITKHTNDIIQKYASGLFRNATLEFYGIKTAPIKELINPELPVVEVTNSLADIVFRLEDDTNLHFAFETGHNSNEAMIKCVKYDIRLHERDKRQVYPVIIYTSDVKSKPPPLKIGALTYAPDVILMNDYDGNTIFAGLEAKINTGQELSELDILNLVLLPLMKHTLPRRELAEKTIKLAQNIRDTQKRNACIAATFAFSKSYLNEFDINKLLEVLNMTNALAPLLYEKAKAIAKNMLSLGMSISDIATCTELDETTIIELQSELHAAA
jgi:hypothetical protein